MTAQASVLDFIRDVTVGLSWPAVTLTALTMFRKPIAGLLDATRKAKFAGVELEIGDRAAITLERTLIRTLGETTMTDPTSPTEIHQREAWVLAIGQEINGHLWPREKAERLHSLLSRPQTVDGIELTDLAAGDAPTTLISAQAEVNRVGDLLFKEGAPATDEGYLAYIRAVQTFTHALFEWLDSRQH